MQALVDLKKRVIVSSILILVVGSLILFSQNLLIEILVALIVAAFAAIAMWEYAHLLKAKQILLPKFLLILLSISYILATYAAIVSPAYSVLPNVVLAGFFFAIFLVHFYHVEGAIVHIASSFFGALYIAIPLGLMLKILYPLSIPSFFTDGRMWITYLLGVTKITDMGGYFAGKLWGKGKLAPNLSPKKTLTGAIAGFFSAVLLSLVFYLISLACSPDFFRISIVEALILGALIGIFAQLGDLAESLLKRDAKIKDSNNIPGIGGVLDLLDSLLFTAPILYLFLKIIVG